MYKTLSQKYQESGFLKKAQLFAIQSPGVIMHSVHLNTFIPICILPVPFL